MFLFWFGFEAVFYWSVAVLNQAQLPIIGTTVQPCTCAVLPGNASCVTLGQTIKSQFLNQFSV